ncbi:MAG: PPOX class F420-dependent oxidoreductase [Chloroflexota bacterium]
MALTFGPRLEGFLAGVQPIIVGTQRQDDTVQMNPVWYEYREGEVWLNGATARGWVKHLHREPRVTLLVVDPKNQFRWAQIQGRVGGMTEDGAADHIDRLSHRYVGVAYQAEKTNRIIVRVSPERVTGGENQQPWDVS